MTTSVVDRRLLTVAGRPPRLAPTMATARRKSSRHSASPLKAHLREADELFHQLPIACAHLDPRGVITAINRAAAALLGIEDTTLLGHSLLVFMTGADRKLLREHLHRVQQASEAVEIDVAFRRPVGQATALHLSSVRTSARGGGCWTILGRNRLGEDSRPGSPAADLTQTLSILSHELRTPLLPALVGASMLAESSTLDVRMRQIAATVQRNVETAAHIIERWLETHAPSENQPPAAAAPQPGTSVDAPAAGSRTRRVLVVEDDAESGTLLETLLRSEGHVVETVGTARDALERARLGFDVVISDVNLPDASALDIVRLLKERVPAPLVIALTGRGSEAERRALLEAGFDVHLLKPVKAERLIEAIGAAPIVTASRPDA